MKFLFCKTEYAFNGIHLRASWRYRKYVSIWNASFPFLLFWLGSPSSRKTFSFYIGTSFQALWISTVEFRWMTSIISFLSSSLQSNGLEACLYMLRQEYCGNLFNSSVPGTPLSTSYRYICGMCYCRFLVFVVYDFVMK